MSDKRRGWLEKLLGNDKAQAVRDDLATAAASLDAVGVERKETSEEVLAAPADAPPANPAPEEGDVVAQVADKLAADVTASVGGDFSQLTEDKLRAMLAAAMNPEAQAEEEAEVPPVEAVPAGNGDQTVEDKSIAALLMAKPPATSPAPAPNAAAGASIPAPSLADAERVKSLLETLDQQVTDQGQMAQELTAQAQELAALKELSPKITELIEWKAQIEQMLAQRPRASEDILTAIPDSDTAKALAESINKGLQGPDQTFLGVRVREIPK